jgi:type I restriction enzyme, S subunit
MPEIILAELERLSSAPESIARLRRFFLDLALRGLLVRQDPNDEPVSGCQHSARAIAGSAPWPIPEGWVWTTLGAVADFSAGRTPSRNDLTYWNPGDYPWVSIADMVTGQTVTSTKETVSDKARTQVFRSAPLPVGTMIMSFKLSIGKVALLGIPAYHNEAIIALRPHNPDLLPYLFKVLPDQSRAGAFKNAIKGATLNRRSLADIRLPIPPDAEQHRIVAKLDQLTTICDELEAAMLLRESSRESTAMAALRSIIVPEVDDDVSRQPAKLYINNARRLITRPEHVGEVRQAVRELAVKGMLVPQNAAEEPASALLAAADETRAGQNARDIHAARTADEPPHVALPMGWEYTVMNRCFGVVGGIQKQPKRTPHTNAFPYLGVANVQRGRLDLTRVANFELFAGELERLRLEPGDLLIVEGNGSADEIGRCARWSGEIPDCVHQNHIIRCRPLVPGIDAFALLYLNSPSGTETMRTLAVTTAGLYNLSVGKIKQVTLPLPPLAEQQRIVAKVNELMKVCSELEASLTSLHARRASLLEATLVEFLARGTDNLPPVLSA